MVRGNSKWKGRVAGLGGLSGPVGIFLCILVVVCTHCAFFGMNLSFQTCFVCEKFHKVGRRRVLLFEGISG